MDERISNLKNVIIKEIIDLMVEVSNGKCYVDFYPKIKEKAFPTEIEEGFYLKQIVTNGENLYVFTINPETGIVHDYDARVVDIEDLVYNLENALKNAKQ